MNLNMEFIHQMTICHSSKEINGSFWSYCK